MKRVVVISDLQIPYEDRRAVKNLIAFIGDYQPDQVIQIGDLMDYPTPSRWSAGTKAEFQEGVIRDSEYAKREFLAPLRAVYDGPVHVLEGNHDERPRKYLASNAPALAAEDTFYRVENLLDFKGFEVTLERPWWSFAPGWVAVHGHETSGLSQQPGKSALTRAEKAGTSVVMGHTHRLCILPKSVGYGGKLRTIYGFEVGHLMDVRKAEYLNNGPANWQRGFGLFYVDKHKAVPYAILVDDDGSFIVEGVRYGAIKRNSKGRFVSE